MKDKHYLCNLQNLKKEGYFVKWIDEWKDELITFLNKDGEIKIFSSICPHFGGEIFFDKKDQVLVCKWHAWKYCSKTGKCLTHSLNLSLDAYGLTVEPSNPESYQIHLNDQQIYAIRNE